MDEAYKRERSGASINVAAAITAVSYVTSRPSV